MGLCFPESLGFSELRIDPIYGIVSVAIRMGFEGVVDLWDGTIERITPYGKRNLDLF